MSFKLIDHSDKVKAAMEQQLKKALIEVGMHIEGEAKEELSNSPKRIDTGLLRNSITWALGGEAPNISSYSGDSPSKYNSKKGIPSGSYSGTAPNDKNKCVYVGTNVAYACYVHEGARNMTPNRFLKNACIRNEKQVTELIKNTLKG